MRAVLAEALMTLAASLLGEARREWAHAMTAEFEAAAEDGKALGFALGCLAAAARELPAHREGRCAIARHLLAFGLLIPAARLLSSLLGGFPSSGLGPEPVLSAANLFAVPPLAALVLALAALHLRLAWCLLERDGSRLTRVAALTGAAAMAHASFTLVVFADPGSAFAQVGIVAVELGVLSALAAWHDGARLRRSAA